MNLNTSIIFPVHTNQTTPYTYSCQYWIPKLKRLCKNKVKNYTFIKCTQHLCKNVYEIPTKCIVCYEKFTTKDYPFGCGHWVHIECIYKSCKQICPICRKYIKFSPHIQSRFNKYSQEQERKKIIAFFSSIDHIENEFNITNINIIPFINNGDSENIETNVSVNTYEPNTNRQLIIYQEPIVSLILQQYYLSLFQLFYSTNTIIDTDTDAI